MEFRFWNIGFLVVGLSWGCQRAPRMDSPFGFRPQAGIVNGSEVSQGDASSLGVVALVRTGAEGEALCTATLISESIALTAAHCLDDHPDTLSLAFNTRLSGVTDEDLRVVDRFLQNPNWKKDSQDPKGRSDLGLVHFEGGLPASYQSARLFSNPSSKVGSSVEVIGYGVDEPASKAGAGLLREATTTVLQDLNDTEVLMSGQDGGVCFGDSGGPAFVGDQLYAVASAVTSELCDGNSVHTRVAPFRDWMDAAADKLNGD